MSRLEQRAARLVADAVAETPPLPERVEDASPSARRFAEQQARRRGVDVALVWAELVAADRDVRATTLKEHAATDEADAIVAGARASSGTALRPAHHG